MRRLFADRLVIATAVIIVTMSAVFALMRVTGKSERHRARTATHGGFAWEVLEAEKGIETIFTALHDAITL